MAGDRESGGSGAEIILLRSRLNKASSISQDQGIVITILVEILYVLLIFMFNNISSLYIQHDSTQ
jgi:hypothetical protein